jgi:hypothetical protein
LETEHNSYAASLIKRKRATRAEMFARFDAIFDIVAEIQPCSVRQAYYQAVVRAIIDKTETDYDKVQTALVKLRRGGRIPYGWITDGTRWRSKPTTYSSVQEALNRTAQLYRKALWDNVDAYVEVWLEKDALSGVVNRVTSEYDVGLHVARGFSSLTFLDASAEDIREIDKPTFIYHLGDHDPSGRNAGEKIEQTLREMAPNAEIHFERLAVTTEQIRAYNLPLRPTKKSDSRAKRFTEEHGEGSVELDAIHPDVLRRIVREAIERHLPRQQLEILKVAEQSERKLLTMWATEARQ